MREHLLKIGEEAYLRKSAFRASHAIVYTGMPSESIYSLGVIFSFGYQAMSFNLFMPVSQREIRYKKWQIEVLEVRPDHIRLRIEKA